LTRNRKSHYDFNWTEIIAAKQKSESEETKIPWAARVIEVIGKSSHRATVGPPNRFGPQALPDGIRYRFAAIAAFGLVANTRAALPWWGLSNALTYRSFDMIGSAPVRVAPGVTAADVVLALLIASSAARRAMLLADCAGILTGRGHDVRRLTWPAC
jgi:hypothetical protein